MSKPNEFLKDKLEKVKSAKRNSFATIALIALLAAGILGRLLWVNMLSGVDFTIGLTLTLVLMCLAVGLSDRHYGKQKSAILEQKEVAPGK